MSVRNLDAVFAPNSIAVIGASETPRSIGLVVTQNVLGGGYAGQVELVNPRHARLFGRRVHRDVAALPSAPDLAVITVPAAPAVYIVRTLAARGTRAAIVIAAGFNAPDGGLLQSALLAAARPALLRVVGPNCLGVLAPAAGLNASFAHRHANPGHIAFVTQSGAVITSVVDWAASRAIGFSLLASLGDMVDVDFGDMLDYLANDSATRAVLLYIEGITHARKFMSAARACARSKPVIVVKAGRHAEAARAAASHTGALAGSDAVYDCAIRRAGMLRVTTLAELFDAAQTLALAVPPHGERLAILTNGGGMGVLATDALIGDGGVLAELSATTRARLDAVLPPMWSHGNPIDIIGDATEQRYADALDVVLGAEELDAVLVLNCPTAVTDSRAAAAAVTASVQRGPRKTVLTSWVGGASAQPARAHLQQHGLPSYESPEDAVRAFMHVIDYRRNQTALLATPPSLANEFTPDRARARATVLGKVAQGGGWLAPRELHAILACYAMPLPATQWVASAEEADIAARRIGGRIALKIVGEGITHKSDVGGVMLNLAPETVFAACATMLARARAAVPQAVISGFIVQQMVARQRALELILGVSDDRDFGPVLLFGHGGTSVEVTKDQALALPPLDLELARDLIARTRVARLLAGYRDVPPADLDALALILVKLSQLVIDLPEILELDLNPVIADATGVLVLDARMRVSAVPAGDRLAIRPYPRELEETFQLDGREFLLRPIRPEDEPALQATFARLTPEEVRYRFFVPMKLMNHVTAARFSQIDYDRQMALVLTAHDAAGTGEIFGVVRLIEDPDRERAEFALLVEHRLSGRGLGSHLMRSIIAYARARGIREMFGEVLADNHRMLGLCRDFGLRETRDLRNPGVVEVSLRLG